MNSIAQGGHMLSGGVVAKLERRLSRHMARRPGRLKLRSAAVSFTFDDVPQSACLRGRQLMESGAGAATYYVCGGYTGTVREVRMHTLADLRSLHAAGHEIACHGFGHHDMQALGPRLSALDMDRNLQYLQDQGLADGSAINFAYPFGCVSPALKREAARRYMSARGVTGGQHGADVDQDLIGAVPLYDAQLSRQAVTELIEANAAQGGWLVFFTHGVLEAPGAYDCSPSLLQHALSVTKATGCEILSVRAALGAGTLHTGAPPLKQAFAA